MALHNLGYRPWSGQLIEPWKRVMVISRIGIRRAWQSGWLRRMVYVAWLPTAWFALGFYIFEQSLTVPDWRDGLEPFLADMSDGRWRDAVRAVSEDDLGRWPWAVFLIEVH